MFFKKKSVKPEYDHDRYSPAVRASICTGEQVAGFRDRETGGFIEEMLIRGEKDLEYFKEKYGIRGEIEKVY